MKTLREELEEILDMGDDVAKEMDITIKGEPTVKVDYIKEILSRHPEEEPLAVLADRKGLWTFKINHYRGDKNWVIFLGVRRQDEIYDEIQFNGITYHEAETKARQYLEGLEEGE